MALFKAPMYATKSNVLPASVDANLLTLVVQLSVVASRARQSDVVALPAAFRYRPFGEAHRQAIGIGSWISGLRDHSVAIADGIGPEQFLPARDLEVHEHRVVHDGRALRHVVVELPIRLRPCLIEIDDRVAAGGLRRGDSRQQRPKCPERSHRGREDG